MILSSLAYITPIRLSFCLGTGEGGGGGGRIFVKKKKIKIGQKRFYSQVNDKEQLKKKKKKRIKDL